MVGWVFIFRVSLILSILTAPSFNGIVLMGCQCTMTSLAKEPLLIVSGGSYSALLLGIVFYYFCLAHLCRGQYSLWWGISLDQNFVYWFALSGRPPGELFALQGPVLTSLGNYLSFITWRLGNPANNELECRVSSVQSIEWSWWHRLRKHRREEPQLLCP